MLKLAILLAFLLVSTICYWVNSVEFWLIAGLVLLLLSFTLPHIRHEVRRFVMVLKLISLTIVLTFLMNLLIGSLDDAIIYTVRLTVMSYFSVLFCALYKFNNLKIAFKTLFTPFNPFIKDLDLIFDITFAFIPTVIRQFTSIKYALQSKGFEFTVRNTFKHPTLFLNVFTTWLLKTSDDLTKSLYIKGVR